MTLYILEVGRSKGILWKGQKIFLSNNSTFNIPSGSHHNAVQRLKPNEYFKKFSGKTYLFIPPEFLPSSFGRL